MTLRFVHVSDVTGWRRCRRQAWITGRWALNLEPMRPNRHLDLGTAVHKGMDVLYSQGGTVTAAVDAVARYYDRGWQKYISHQGFVDETVRGEWLEDKTMAAMMIAYYADWAKTVDDEWEVIDTEREFTNLSFPFSEFTVAPEYVGDGTVYLMEGKIDGIVMHKPTGTLWLREYKTAGSIPEEQKRIEKSTQAMVYCYVASKLVGRPIAGIEYRFMRKAVPQIPRVVRGGKLSIALTGDGEYTTVETFRAAFEQLYQIPPTDGNIIDEGYGEHLIALTQRGNQFFVQYKLHKTTAECVSAVEKMYYTAQEMFEASHNRFTQITWDEDWYKCKYCPVSVICDKMNKGYDVTVALRNEFRVRTPDDTIDAPVLPEAEASEGFSAEVEF